MDHRGRAFDNIFIERLWRSLKYEDACINCYDTPRSARAGIGKYLDFYNNERPHQSLGYKTPSEIAQAKASQSQYSASRPSPAG
jgi:putative transposase